MQDISDADASAKPSVIVRFVNFVKQRHQKFLDDVTPYTQMRWIATFILLVVYTLRFLYLQGWYIITYALGIYLLNLFIAFLSPRIDPAMEDNYDDDGPTLPVKADEEFRPFIRRLPEFKFWYGSTRATLIALFCTFFDVFNIPVFWPILVMYFIILFVLTMKRQIKHMIRYKYLPFTHGKRKYQGKDDDGKLVKS